ncbi:hypothetical protein RDI58_007669 [Solanum bulbocastanum]|uniref:Uncharacterized protein n=1 Tax=Solanum bulbocastanum TaxID=147425 RepID=A0AAN8YJH0_SOLBU
MYSLTGLNQTVLSELLIKFRKLSTILPVYYLF